MEKCWDYYNPRKESHFLKDFTWTRNFSDVGENPYIRKQTRNTAQEALELLYEFNNTNQDLY
jgi:hypothetical protein